jgi:hypothetical protein
MSRLTTVLLSIATAAGLLLAAGCDSAGPAIDDSEEDGGSTTLQMHLTDAPGDVTKANVLIESVSIVPEEDTSNGDSTDVGVSVLSEESFEVDLTQLEGEVDTLLGTLDLKAGTYSQVRMITADPENFDVRYETAQGDTAQANLKIPSGEQTGIKVNFGSPLAVDGSIDTVDVTLDFDVKESFISRGPDGQTSDYNFKPTVQATVDTIGGGN